MYASSTSSVRPTQDLRIFSGRAHLGLAKEIADIIGVELSPRHLTTFPDSETHVQIEESVRGADIFIIQPTCPPVNENLMELLVMLDALRRASAGPITAVVPYYGYARQDRKSTGREPITAKLVADLIAHAGASRVVSVDLHVAQIQGFFDIPMDHLTSMTTIANHIQQSDLSNAVVVSPDVGRAKLAEKYADVLDLPLALMHKRRSGVGGSGAMEVVEIIGDVKGKTPLVVDDVISGGSIINQARALVEAGSNPVTLIVTHGILVGKALERLAEDCVERVIVTNTVPVPDEKRIKLPKLEVLSIAPLLAEVIQKVHNCESVSSVFSKHRIDFPV
ncbi:MAG: ribose-phosphate pyrophosphokinase [Candidatus Poribacteria bacterium]|nr:ribose-phosphate pyrophosphokinase [Candidatus Poribacteria bacterium]